MNKNIQRICILLFIIAVQSCTLIEKEKYLIDYTPPIAEGPDMRYILLEDYTGIGCSNCPRAAEKARVLKEIYGKRFIPVAIHAGWFARPQYGYDLQTTAGTEYYTYFKVESPPKGIINRTKYKDQVFYPDGDWDGATETVPLKADFGIETQTQYNAVNRTYRIETQITRFQTTAHNAINLIFWLVEDNIITAQKIEDGTTVKNYLQRHVFRGALNGSWGKPASISDVIEIPTSQAIQEYTLPKEFKEVDCSIVTLLCDRDSKEVVQVHECSLLP